MNNNMENYVSRTSGVPDMTQYIGTKIVNAKPMNRGEFNCFMEGDPAFKPVGYINGATADDKGYLVEYLDGGKPNKPHLSENYLSWSPADVFEKAYKVVQAVSQNELTTAFAVVSKAMQSDDGYAQTWHSNLACLLTDAGVPHDIATIRAARFMNLAFGADTTNCVPVKQSEAFVSRYQEDIVPGKRYVVKNTISRCHQHVDEYYLVNAASARSAISNVRAVTGEESVLEALFKVEHVNCAWDTPTTEEAANGIIGKCFKPLGTAAIETVRSLPEPVIDYLEFVPELRTGANVTHDNSAYFVDVADLPPVTKNLRGINVVTSALKIDMVVSLIGISQVDEMILRGDMNHFDVVSKTMQLRSLIIKDSEHVFELPVHHLHGSNFQYAVQGNTRTLHLDFVTDGAIMIHVYGEFNLETTCGSVGAAVLNDASTGKTALQVIGYNLNAYRHNPSAT